MSATINFSTPLRTLLNTHGACDDGLKWTKGFGTAADAWEACSRLDHMLWAIYRLQHLPNLKVALTKAAYDILTKTQLPNGEPVTSLIVHQAHEAFLRLYTLAQTRALVPIESSLLAEVVKTIQSRSLNVPCTTSYYQRAAQHMVNAVREFNRLTDNPSWDMSVGSMSSYVQSAVSATGLYMGLTESRVVMYTKEVLASHCQMIRDHLGNPCIAPPTPPAPPVTPPTPKLPEGVEAKPKKPRAPRKKAVASLAAVKAGTCTAEHD